MAKAPSSPATLAGRFMRVIDRTSDVLAVIAGVLLFALGPMITISVIMRYFFKMSVAWTTEIEEYFLYTAVLFAAPWVMRRDAHVRVDILLMRAGDAGKRVMQLAGNAFGLLASAGLFYFGWLATYENLVRGTKIIKVMPIPKFLPLLLVPIVALILFFIFLRNIWEWWHGIPLQREKDVEDEPAANLSHNA